jgi:Tol biopolymer transport system component
MFTDNWRTIERLYHEALARPAVERAAFLAGASADEAVRREVLSLLAQPAATGFLSGQAVDLAAAMIDAEASQWIGRRIGVYELHALLGKGGMGEVYRARDTRLGREVAIKVLPRAFTADSERLARFEREARHLAALNHPHIGALYGLEEGDGNRALVLELVEGETLEDRVGRGAMAISDALIIARQVADALEFAHEKGIVHRDLKPANIKITPEGTAKVLDFGLAKASVAESLVADPAYTPNPTAGVTEEGIVLGTPAYMSPEQARGRPVDKRTDIWAFGCVLYAMLTGRLAFRGETASDMMAAVLEREPDWTALPTATPRAIDQLLRRCVEKDAKRRLRDIGEARFAIDEALSRPAGEKDVAEPSGRRLAVLPWTVALAAVVAAIVGFWRVPAATQAWQNPLADATFSEITNWAGTEADATISPDGKFVAFVADRDGQFDVFLSQIGTGRVRNLTPDAADDRPNRAGATNLGFTGDGSEVWLAGGPGGARLRKMPLLDGPPTAFLGENVFNVAWSPDGKRTTYYDGIDGDPMYVGDGNGGNPVKIFGGELGIHNHGPIWSADGQWIYFIRGLPMGGQMDVWRVRPSGAQPDQLTQNGTVSSLTPLDPRTVIYVASAEDGSGPWLWVLDVESRASHRVNLGLQQYTSIAASANGRRLVASVARPRAGLWTVPIREGRPAADSDVQPYELPGVRALAPRARGTSLFYLSSQGTGDGLWRHHDGTSVEIWQGSQGVLLEPAAVSPDGLRVVVALRKAGKRILTVVSTDGAQSRTLKAPDVGGTFDFSPDGTWLVVGGDDGLFKVPVDGGSPVQLVRGRVFDPVWSPRNDLILYTEPNKAARAPLKGVRPDGVVVAFPGITVLAGSGVRFLPDGSGAVFAEGNSRAKDFWLLDILTGKTHQLTQLTTKPDEGYIGYFDITPDGKQIIFDRTSENSDVVLIDLPRH